MKAFEITEVPLAVQPMSYHMKGGVSHGVSTVRALRNNNGDSSFVALDKVLTLEQKCKSFLCLLL